MIGSHLKTKIKIQDCKIFTWKIKFIYSKGIDREVDPNSCFRNPYLCITTMSSPRPIIEIEAL